jgi:hypothetical protein
VEGRVLNRSKRSALVLLVLLVLGMVVILLRLVLLLVMVFLQLLQVLLVLGEMLFYHQAVVEGSITWVLSQVIQRVGKLIRSEARSCHRSRRCIRVGRFLDCGTSRASCAAGIAA